MRYKSLKSFRGFPHNVQRRPDSTHHVKKITDGTTQDHRKGQKIARADSNVSAVLMYGSFIRDEGDEHSDVEFYVYLNDKSGFESRLWVEQIRSIAMFFTNEHGTEVAIFDNMIRGEFHFGTLDDLETIKTWQGFISFEHTEKMKLVDKDGRLVDVLDSIEIVKPNWRDPENVRWIAESFLNVFLWTRNLIARAEDAHAVMAFSFVQKHFLSLIQCGRGGHCVSGRGYERCSSLHHRRRSSGKRNSIAI